VVTIAPGRGRKVCTSEKTVRRIARLALKNRKATANEINMALQDSGVNVSNLPDISDKFFYKQKNSLSVLTKNCCARNRAFTYFMKLWPRIFCCS